MRWSLPFPFPLDNRLQMRFEADHTIDEYIDLPIFFKDLLIFSTLHVELIGEDIYLSVPFVNEVLKPSV